MNSRDVLGTWELLSYVDVVGDDVRPGPLGDHPRGLLVYTADGHMSVSMMRTGPAPESTGPDDQVETFMGYAGTWRASGSEIRHTVLVSAHSRMVGSELVRHAALDGDVLTLHGTSPVNGRPRRRRLVWRRTTPTLSNTVERHVTMKALVAPSYGPIDQLTLAELAKPAPGPGQILIKLRAAALNPLDVKLATGVMREMMPVSHPFVLGLDAAGTVEAVGEGVTRFSPGDEVVAFTHPVAGAVAEYTLALDGPEVVARPETLDPVDAAALPVAAMTAAGIVEQAGLNSGDSLLVVGATGGVGSFVVQLAAQAGVRVVATAPPSDADYVRGLGATATIDYTSADTTEEALRHVPGGVDVAVDLINAGPGLAGTAAAVKPGGLLISPAGGPPVFDREVRATYAHIEATDGRLQRIVEATASGELRVEVSAQFPFAEAQRGVAEFAGKHTRGKVVITF
ncbi:lipocalin-like domain-containing protein [Micromonospora sp. NPDC049101]|uniref:lipocalin-like domain-containing protein n=1 Tax=unclassified Micromonospora TaxID=2617518 RepID=UPI0033CED8AF